MLNTNALSTIKGISRGGAYIDLKSLVISLGIYTKKPLSFIADEKLLLLFDPVRQTDIQTTIIE